MIKKELYEYLDVIDSKSMIVEIEKKPENEDKISWKILLSEIKKYIIINDNIKEFINKTKKNIKISELYYSSINIISDEDHDKINMENNRNFNNMLKKIILENINNKHFYNLQKNKIHKDIKLISLLFEKITKDNIANIDNLLKDKIKILAVRKFFLNLYCHNIDFFSYEDDIILNTEDIFDIIEVNNFYHPILPNFIKIKEFNSNNTLIIFNPIVNYTIECDIVSEKDILINIINKYVKNKKVYISTLYFNRKNIIIEYIYNFIDLTYVLFIY